MDDEHAIAHIMRISGCTREVAATRLNAARRGDAAPELVASLDKFKEEKKKTRATRDGTKIPERRR
jgi:hypothetical protein